MQESQLTPRCLEGELTHDCLYSFHRSLPSTADSQLTCSSSFSESKDTSSQSSIQDSHDDIKANLIRSIFETLQKTPPTAIGSTSERLIPSGSLRALYHTPPSISETEEVSFDDQELATRIPSVLLQYNREPQDPPALNRPIGPPASRRSHSFSNSSTNATLQCFAGNKNHICTLPMEELLARFESIRSYRAARLDGELEVVTAWRQAQGWMQQFRYQRSVSVPIPIWKSLCESLLIVLPRISIKETLEILNIQVLFLSTGRDTRLPLSHLLYERWADRCSKILNNATWEDLRSYCLVSAKLLEMACSYKGQSIGNAPTQNQYDVCRDRGDTVMPMVEVAVQQLRTNYDGQCAAIERLVGVQNQGSSQHEHRRLSKVTVALSDALVPLLTVHLSPPQAGTTDKFKQKAVSKSFKASKSLKITKKKKKKTRNLVVRGITAVAKSIGGAFATVGRAVISFGICYVPTEEDSPANTVRIIRRSDTIHKEANIAPRMDGFAVEHREETWYETFSKKHTDVWTERRRNIILDLGVIVKGLVETLIPCSVSNFTAEQLTRTVKDLSTVSISPEGSCFKNKMRHGAAMLLSQAGRRVRHQNKPSKAELMQPEQMLDFIHVRTILEAAHAWDWDETLIFLTVTERKDTHRVSRALLIMQEGLQRRAETEREHHTAKHVVAASLKSLTKTLDRTPAYLEFSFGLDIHGVLSDDDSTLVGSPTSSSASPSHHHRHHHRPRHSIEFSDHSESILSESLSSVDHNESTSSHEALSIVEAGIDDLVAAAV